LQRYNEGVEGTRKGISGSINCEGKAEKEINVNEKNQKLPALPPGTYEKPFARTQDGSGSLGRRSRGVCLKQTELIHGQMARKQSTENKKAEGEKERMEEGTQWLGVILLPTRTRQLWGGTEKLGNSDGRRGGIELNREVETSLEGEKKYVGN